MKASRIIWPVLLIATGFTCLFSWLAIPQPASQARIKVENDVIDIPGTPAASKYVGLDPYFIAENRCDRIFISKRSKVDPR
jgi:uncharacterized protein involved in exopolysaccharide biosynthesis